MSPLSPKWRPHSDGNLKINSDASFISHTSRVYGCIIMRDHHGKVVAGDTFLGVVVDALSVETLVMRKGLLLYMNLRVERVVIKSDCLELVSVCCGEAERRSVVIIPNDIATIKCSFRSCGFTWVARKGNHSVHTGTDLLRRCLLPPGWYHFPPPQLHDTLMVDASRCQN